MRIPDAYDLWEQYDAEQERKLNRLPKCVECGEPIQQSDAVYVFNGWICDGCLEELRREVLPEW